MKIFSSPKGRQKMNKKINIWKVVSVVFIFLFILVIAGGIFRVSHSRGSLMTPTQDQINYARDIVAAQLQDSGDNISDYKVTISNDIREFGPMPLDRRGFGPMMPPQAPSKVPSQGTRNIIQVSLHKNSTMQLFLIDIDSGEILMHSRTDFYGGMGNLIGSFVR